RHEGPLCQSSSGRACELHRRRQSIRAAGVPRDPSQDNERDSRRMRQPHPSGAQDERSGYIMVNLNSRDSVSELLDQVVDLSVEAGNAIIDIYNGPAFQVTHKDNKSPLTAADIASHDTIVKALQQLTPEWPVLSEE